MFEKAKNMDQAFQQTRLVALVVIAACVVICCFALYTAHRAVTRSSERIYILSGGKAMEALAGDRKENLPVEARDHIRAFHTAFFALDPDDQVIRANITKALYLADGSAKKVYESLKENNYYARIISGNISQELTVDSIRLEMGRDPIYFRCYATERITRPSSVTTRSLITEGYLRPVARSDNNPHGFLIERWNTVENKDLQTEPR